MPPLFQSVQNLFAIALILIGTFGAASANATSQSGFWGKLTWEHRKSQMDGARFAVVEDQHAERKRQRRGDPELEQRPDDGHRREKNRRQADRFATAGIGFGDEPGERVVAGRLQRSQPRSR